MRTIQLKINALRRRKGISQQVLADALGVTFQTVSKWENMTNMPDISILPAVADYFQVTVDQLLGLQPLQGEEYIPARTGTREYWDYIGENRDNLSAVIVGGLMISYGWKL